MWWSKIIAFYFHVCVVTKLGIAEHVINISVTIILYILYSLLFVLFVRISPAPSSSPVGVNRVQLNATFVVLQWSPPPSEHINGIIRAYTVTVSEHETGWSYNLSSPHTELSIGNLHPFYWYSFSVCAVTVAPGTCTDLYTLQTLEHGKGADF